MGPVVSGPVGEVDELDGVAIGVVTAGDEGVGVGFGSSPLPVHAARNPTISAIASNRVGTPK